MIIEFEEECLREKPTKGYSATFCKNYSKTENS